MGLDADTGDSRSTVGYFLQDSFFQQYGALAYTTLSDAPEYRKCRAVFSLDAPITDAARYRALKVALMKRYSWTDAAVKDTARFLYGSRPGSGDVVLVGNILPATVAEEMIASVMATTTTIVERPPRSMRLMGNSPTHRYVARAVKNITGTLASAPAIDGERYSLLIPTTLRLQGLKIAA